MKLISSLYRRVRSFIRTHRARENEEGNNHQEPHEQASSIWEEKQILLLECLCDYTTSLSKGDFHELPPSADESDPEKGDADDDKAIALVSVPSPGVSLESNDDLDGKRKVSAMCAICLCAYEPDDRVTWSSNPGCHHVYHEECIIQWLVSLIHKQRAALRRQRERERRNRNRQGHNRRNTGSQQRSGRQRRGRNTTDGAADNATTATATTTATTNASYVNATTTTTTAATTTNNTTDDNEASASASTATANNTAAENARNSDAENVPIIPTPTSALNASAIPVVSDSDLLKTIPKECPCCRQDFIVNTLCVKAKPLETDAPETNDD